MAIFTIPFTTPANYTYDNSKIEVSGGLGKLKENSIWNGIASYWRMEEASWDGTPGEVIDTVGVNNGQALNGANTTASGKIGRGGSFGGAPGTKHIILNNYAYVDGDFTFACWVKAGSPGANLPYMVSGSQSGVWDWPFWGVRMQASGSIQVFYGTGPGTFTSLVTAATYNDNSWHLVTIWRDANVLFLRIDGSGTISSPANYDMSTVVDNRLANSGAGTTINNWHGYLDEVVFFSRTLTSGERDTLYSAGSGSIIYKNDNNVPDIYKTAGNSDLGIFSFNNFSVTEGVNEGNITYQLSEDGVTWKYWNGSAWANVTAGQTNTEATVDTNISSFSVASDSIFVKTFLISNGYQEVEIDEIQVTYSTNQAPIVDAGTNKTTKDNTTISPFSDCSFSDPDGIIDVARYKVDGEVDVWTEIPQGAFGTLLEAVRDFDYTYANLGVLTTRLQVEDNIGATADDSLTVTVSKYTKTVNIKSSVSGEHLAGVQFDAGDGAGFSTKNSPFNYDWEFGAFDVSIFRDVFNQVNIPISVSDESDLTFLIAPVEILNIAQASVGVIVDTDTLCISAWLSQNGIIVTTPTSCSIQLIDCGSGSAVFSNFSTTHTGGHFRFSANPSGLPQEGVYYLTLSIVNNGITVESTYPVGTMINRNLMDENLSNHKDANTVGEGINELLDMVFGDIDLNSDSNTQTFYRRDGTLLKVYNLLKTIRTLPSYIGRTLRS